MHRASRTAGRGLLMSGARAAVDGEQPGFEGFWFDDTGRSVADRRPWAGILADDQWAGDTTLIG